MMSSPLFNSLPQVRLSCPLSPALPVAVIKSGYPESVSPPHDCSHVYFQQNEFSPSRPLLPDLYFAALDVPSCSWLSPTRCKCFPFIHTSSPTPSPSAALCPSPPASAVVSNTVSHLISNSVIQKPRTSALRKGPRFSFQSQIKSITPRSLYHSVWMTGGLEYSSCQVYPPLLPFSFPVCVSGALHALLNFSPGKVDREGLSLVFGWTTQNLQPPHLQMGKPRSRELNWAAAWLILGGTKTSGMKTQVQWQIWWGKKILLRGEQCQDKTWWLSKSSSTHFALVSLPAEQAKDQSRACIPVIDPPGYPERLRLLGAWRPWRLPVPLQPGSAGQDEGSETARLMNSTRVPHPLGFSLLASTHCGKLTENSPLSVGRCIKYTIPVKRYLLQKSYQSCKKAPAFSGERHGWENE